MQAVIGDTFCDAGYHPSCNIIGCDCWCHTSPVTPFVFDDGGRSKTSFKGYAGDCGVRAISIVLEADYAEVYADAAARNRAFHLHKAERSRRPDRVAYHEKKAVRSAREGLPTPVMSDIMNAAGFHYLSLTHFGRPPGRFSDLPATGRLLVYLRGHFTSVIDGTIHDTFDASDGYDRSIYGFYRKAPTA
jgi:hypothetical protein